MDGSFFLIGGILGILFAHKRQEPKNPQKVLAPVDPSDLLRYGQSVMADRGNKNHTRHSGIDIFVKKAGVPVYAIGSGVVIRKHEQKCSPGKPCAGLFVDIKLDNGIIARYLHLGAAYVKKGDKVTPGYIVGKVAETGQSGLGSSPPHLHFELRKSDWSIDDYGAAIDPRPLLQQVA